MRSPIASSLHPIDQLPQVAGGCTAGGLAGQERARRAAISSITGSF